MRVKPRNVSSSTRDDVNVMIEIAAPLALRLCRLIARPGWDNRSQPRNASTPRTCDAARAKAAAKVHKIAGHVRGCGKSAGDSDIYFAKEPKAAGLAQPTVRASKGPAALAFAGFGAYIPGHPRQQNVLLCGGPKGSPRGEGFCFAPCWSVCRLSRRCRNWSRSLNRW